MTDFERPGVRHSAAPHGAALVRAHVAILAERVWPYAFALLCLLALFLVVAWFGLFALGPALLRTAILALFGVGVLAILWQARRLRVATRAEVIARVEAASRLEHQPLAAQGDRAIGEDPFARALWQAHQQRMAARLKNLQVGAPRTRTSRLDPLGLRVVLAMLLFTAFTYSLGPGGGRVADAFAPFETAILTPVRLDAWVTPPTYTGRPPLFLEGVAPDVLSEMPEGSVLSARLSNASGTRVIFAPASGAPEREITPVEQAAGDVPTDGAPVAGTYETVLNESGAMRVETRLSTLGSWRFAVLADLPPNVAFNGAPTQARNGALELNYTVSDDYRVRSGQATIRPLGVDFGVARPLVAPPEIRLSLPRTTRGETNARTSVNIAESPYAGATVALTLSVTDDADQVGETPPLETVLPSRPFRNPLARAIVEQRRILALDANAAGRVVAMLDAVTFRGEEFIDDASAFLALRAVRTRIATARDDAALVSSVDFLWEIALGIEDGELSVAERRLQEAQENLAEALENGASDEEVAALMEELRAAMQEFMAQMAEAMRNMPPQNQAEMGNAQEIRPQDLERMLDQIEDLARSGSREAAQELLAQLQDMMNNLQAMQQQGQPGEPQQSQAQQQMNQLGELLQRQQELMDETFALGREQAQRSEQEERGEGSQMSAEELRAALDRLQSEQGALQEQLQALQEAMEGSGMQPGEGLGKAGEAMGEASGALGEGDDGRAVGRQGEAMEALRRGAQEMMDAMSQQAGQGQGQGQQPGQGRMGQGFGPGQQRSGRDPLGRERQTQGPDFGQDVDVPDEIDIQRARRILDQIRNRLGDALSPQLEREYLERLLETP